MPSMGMQDSSLGVISPYFGLPNKVAGRTERQFIKPIARGFGFRAPGGQYEDILAKNAAAGQPLANVISSVREQVPMALSKSQEIGSDIASRAPALYNTLQTQISSFLESLPNMKAVTERALSGTETARGAAESRLSDAMAPGRSSALFTRYAEPALALARQGAAARGIAGTGAAQAGEEDLLRDLTLDYIMNQGTQQDAAIQSLLGASQGSAPLIQLLTGLGQAGIGGAQAGMEALPALGQLLSSEYAMPLSTASNILSLLQGAQQPGAQFLQTISPATGTEGSGWNFSSAGK